MMDQLNRVAGSKLPLILIMLVLAAGPGIVVAEGLYVGGSYGWAEGKDDDFDDDSSNSWRAFFGASANRIIGWEIGYTELNQFNGAALGDIDITAWDLSLLGGFPIGPVTPFARVGAVWSDVSTSNFGSDSDWKYKYGLGLDLNLGKTFALRFEVDRTEVDTGVLETEVDTASLGVLFRFGGK